MSSQTVRVFQLTRFAWPLRAFSPLNEVVYKASQKLCW